MSALTAHLVTRDPAAAAAWYGSVLGAVEGARITLPGGRVLSIDLRFGDSKLAIGEEFPDLGIVPPQTLGGTYGALHLAVEDAGAVWRRALDLLPPDSPEFQQIRQRVGALIGGWSSAASAAMLALTLRERVERAMRALDYEQNMLAHAQRRQRAPVVGLSVPHVEVRQAPVDVGGHRE